MLRRTVLLLSSFLLFTTLAVAGNKVEKKQSDIKVNVDVNSSTAVLSETDEIASTNTPTPTFSPTVTPTEEIEVDEPDPTSTPANKLDVIDDYVYPGTLVSVKTQNSFTGTSNDDPKKVTDWYETKVRSNGFNVKSFVKTNTNNVIKNVISAANATQEVKVEIVNNGSGSSITVNFY